MDLQLIPKHNCWKALFYLVNGYIYIFNDWEHSFLHKTSKTKMSNCKVSLSSWILNIEWFLHTTIRIYKGTHFAGHPVE